MLQHDPTLTQADVLAALQGGAHPLRGAAPYADQSGVGEVDVLGAVEAVDRMRSPTTSLPVRAAAGSPPGPTSTWPTARRRWRSSSSCAPRALGSARAAAGRRLRRRAPRDVRARRRRPQRGAVQSSCAAVPACGWRPCCCPRVSAARGSRSAPRSTARTSRAPSRCPSQRTHGRPDYPASVSGGCGVARARGEQAAGASMMLVTALLFARRRRRHWLRSACSWHADTPRAALSERRAGPCCRADTW